MEDKVSQDSLSVTEEFVLVEGQSEMAHSNGGSIRSEEGLKIAGNGDMEQLQHRLEEATASETDESNTDRTYSGSDSYLSSARGETSEAETEYRDSKGELSPSRMVMQTLEEKVLNSHVHVQNSPKGGAPQAEGSPDPWEPRSGGTTGSPQLAPLTIPPLEKTCVLFSGIIYLGSATVNAPKSEMEVARNMSILREQESHTAINIILSVPRTSEGSVRLLEPDGRSEISHFRITRILFCCRGLESGPDADCFAFTCSHGSRESQLFQCHVFRCEKPEAVQKVLSCFGQAFHRVPKSPQMVESSMHVQAAAREKILNLTIPVFLDIREEDGKGNYVPVPRDTQCFKLKQGAKKEIAVTIQSNHFRMLNIEKCFGLLICPGKEVPDREMHLLDVVGQEYSHDSKSFVVTSLWDPNVANLGRLNIESPTGLDKGMFMTVAVDLVITGIQEPVRFIVEIRVKIVSPTEKYWIYNKKPIQEFFYLLLEEEESNVENEFSYKVLSLESQTHREKAHLPMRARGGRTPDSINSVPEEEESDDEPLQSGSGSVDKDCDEDILLTWGNILAKWRMDLGTRPKQLKPLVRKGIPEALRGEVWQLLSRVHESEELFEDYRILITKESPMEEIISRDISRTFTAHEKFQTEDEGGQEAMFKISKAYSIYDSEVAYCQGMSFLTAVLWLHMPEEQAFAILVKIMYDYGLRDLFLDNFKVLHKKFYQLDRLIEDLLPDLFHHFVHIGIEVHMFASQWFLTLFTHKFPLTTVFHIIDVYLSEGMGVVFNIAIALLKASKKDLVGLDFEGVLKYFRVTLPKKYRTDEAATELIQLAMSMKINSKKLTKYEREYFAIKEEEEREDPNSRLERENKTVMSNNMRLEQENDELAHELITYKLAMEKTLDSERDRVMDYEKEVKSLKLQLIDFEEENKHLESETCQVKEMYRQAMEKAELDSKRNETIIAEYKQICSQQSERLEKLQNFKKEEMLLLKSKLESCEKCCSYIDDDGKLVQSVQDAAVSSKSGHGQELEDALNTVRELELELAQTKLKLVESQCKAQDLEHELSNVLSEMQQSSQHHRSNSWITNAFSSLKEAAVVKKE